MENKLELLKFITCGSVDDGKSTLIGHMLYKAKLIFADQEKALELDSKLGSNDGELDYSLLLDGLMAEREQGITIDVAYRYFTTESRSFIVADCPGHEQYTRNMAVGASFADLAVILVDASKGVLLQTKRHARICALMGVKHFVLAINKIDLVGYNKDIYEDIKKEFKELCANFDIETIQVIPVSAKQGDNIVDKSLNMTWYDGLALLPYLESVKLNESKVNKNFTMTVQRVCRPNANFRGFQGQVQTGVVKVGDEIKTLPEGEKAVVKEIFVTDRPEKEAIAGQPVTITLDREIDISRGSVLTIDMVADSSSKTSNNDQGDGVETADMFTTTMLWMDDKELVEGRNYLLKLGTKILPATVMKIKYKIDVNTGKHINANKAFKNELVECEISLANSIAITAFEKNEALGRFILIDRLTNMTSGAGVVSHTLRRSTNIVWQETDITKEIRENQKDQKAKTLWFTGLSGSGKSTLANAVEKKLVALGKHTMLLDGDNVRHGLNKNLGFTEQDRIENIRRVSEVAKLMNDAGLIVLTSFISPFEQDREEARRIIGDDYIEIFVSTPIEVCEARDVKGLYKKARNGEIPNFTGINSPYEVPTNSEIVINTVDVELDRAADMIIEKLCF